MGFWMKLVLTFVAIILASVIAGYLWNALFNAEIPSFLGGMLGGIVAIPVWEFLKKFNAPGTRAGEGPLR
ncbi:MAG: hypothetical protein CVT73_03845 [Alphaproteobacteria bacterium HGW-Alphaproteobacteria-12]|nr:MAG: hypothetical protein CVT73_03845 [Alphaproteobacteria bacterium HGW-Alphaproteobacteria-12]